MTIPILILGVDGVRDHDLNEKMFWTGTTFFFPNVCHPKLFSIDVLTMVAGFGCCISSGITLVVRLFSSFIGLLRP